MWKYIKGAINKCLGKIVHDQSFGDTHESGTIFEEGLYVFKYNAIVQREI